MRRLKAIAACSVGLAGAAHAEGSVQAYGIVNTGVMYVSNQGGSSNLVADPGTQAPTLFGFRGTEELGGGLQAVFKLQGQFSMKNGQSIGNLFGHESYVGLRDDKLGTLTLGNQIDFMFYSLALDHWGSAFPFISCISLRQGPFSGLGVPNTPGGSFDFDRVAGLAMPNSVKYQSPDFGGLSVGAQYSLGGQPGSFGNSSGQSAGVNYHVGNLRLNGAYTYVKYPQLNAGNDGIRNFGFGGSYAIGPAVAALMYTNTENTATGARVAVYEGDVTWAFSPAWHLNAVYQYMRGNDTLDRQSAMQGTLTLLYSFSKRTSVYADLVYQKASGAGKAWISLAPGPSSGATQVAANIGVLHAF